MRRNIITAALGILLSVVFSSTAYAGGPVDFKVDYPNGSSANGMFFTCRAVPCTLNFSVTNTRGQDVTAVYWHKSLFEYSEGTGPSWSGTLTYNQGDQATYFYVALFNDGSRYESDQSGQFQFGYIDPGTTPPYRDLSLKTAGKRMGSGKCAYSTTLNVRADNPGSAYASAHLEARLPGKTWRKVAKTAVGRVSASTPFLTAVSTLNVAPRSGSLGKLVTAKASFQYVLDSAWVKDGTGKVLFSRSLLRYTISAKNLRSCRFDSAPKPVSRPSLP